MGVKAKPVIGWREWVSLPGICSLPIKAKVDTGARTSSLHAFDLELVTSADGLTIAKFEIHPEQRSSRNSQLASVPVHSFREVRSSMGQRQRRPVIETMIAIGDRVFSAEITLTARDDMGFRMLLGRAAVRRRFLVDPGRSYQQGSPQ